MAKISYSPEAKNDLLAIKAYIENELHNHAAARRVVTRITQKCRLLEKAPYIGTSLSSVINIDTDYRFLPAGNYLSIYRYMKQENICNIIRVLYMRRDYLTILFGSSNENDDIDSDEEIT